MHKVTQQEFYARINPLNVVGSIQPGPWPYTTVFKLQSGSQQVIGKVVGRLEHPGRSTSDYFLADR